LGASHKAGRQLNRKLPWKQMPRRAWDIWREEGFRSLFFRVLGETVYRRMVLFERPLSDPIPSAAATIPVEVSLLEPSEVDEYAAFHPSLDAAQVRDRLNHGGKCFISRHEGSIVNACWTAEGSVLIDYLGCSIQLAHDEVYVYNNYTSPRFRGCNVSIARAAVMLRHFRELGYRRLIAVVVPENKAAFRSPDKAGYRRMGLIGYIKIGPWRHNLMSAWRQRGHFE
jgi:ribosomal protein S18 acetylase RimI-like enzyme